MDEQFISRLFEMGITSGGFVYLLFLITNKFSKTLEEVSASLKDVGQTNAGILQAINSLNERVSHIERKSDE